MYGGSGGRGGQCDQKNGPYPITSSCNKDNHLDTWRPTLRYLMTMGSEPKTCFTESLCNNRRSSACDRTSDLWTTINDLSVPCPLSGHDAVHFSRYKEGYGGWVDLSIDWLNDWSVDRLVDWSIDRLIETLVCSHTVRAHIQYFKQFSI